MKIWHISDTHGLHDQLVIPVVDLIIHSGDVSNWKDERNANEVLDFLEWYAKIPCKKILVGGNHDVSIERGLVTRKQIEDFGIIYLENELYKVDGIRIWGSPYTPSFGVGWAWNIERHEIQAVWDLIPECDIVVTHGPPYGILDIHEDNGIEYCGCKCLLNTILRREPQYHLFGHIHNVKDTLNQGLRNIAGYKTVFSNGSVCAIPKNNVSSNGNIISI